jgi:hypothetical protein
MSRNFRGNLKSFDSVVLEKISQEFSFINTRKNALHYNGSHPFPRAIIFTTLILHYVRNHANLNIPGLKLMVLQKN